MSIDKVPVQTVVGTSALTRDLLGIVTAGLAVIALLLDVLTTGCIGLGCHDSTVRK